MQEEQIIKLRQIISDLLRVSPSEIKDTTDLFDLGFHSLIASQLVSRIRSELGIKLHISDLFTSPCIEGIAEAINRRRVVCDE